MDKSGLLGRLKASGFADVVAKYDMHLGLKAALHEFLREGEGGAAEEDVPLKARLKATVALLRMVPVDDMATSPATSIMESVWHTNRGEDTDHLLH